MNTRIDKLSAARSGRIMIVLALMTFAFACKKSNNDTKSNPSTSPVIGTYYGNLSVGSYVEPDTIVIQAGSGSSVVMSSKTGTGSAYSINGTASGNTISITSQSVYVPSLNATYTVTGSGTLTNSTMVINYVFVSSSHVSTNSTFTGQKQ